MGHNIAPEHGLPVPGDEISAQLSDEADIVRFFALRLHGFLSPAFSQVEGFIGTEVELPGGKKRNEFIQHPRNELKGLGLADVQGVMMHTVDHGGRQSSLHFAQMAVGFCMQELKKMTEAGQARHQLDAPAGTVGIQIQDLLSGQGPDVPPDLGQIPEQIGVLHIELKLIQLEKAGDVGQLFQGFQGGHPPPGHIMIKAAGREAGRILHGAAGQAAAGLAKHLPEGLNAVKDSDIRTAPDAYSPGRNLQMAGLRIQAAVRPQGDVSFPGSAA